MMISRTMGYQEKSAKHSTAPMRNPCAERLRRSCWLRLLRTAGRTTRPGLPLALRSGTAVSVIDSPDSPGTRPASKDAMTPLGAGGRGDAQSGALAPGRAAGAGNPAPAAATYPPLLARSVLTLPAAAESSLL